MIEIGLTGNVASGKSTVARRWREAGVPILDADQLSREVVRPGTPGLQAVVEAFGEGILASDGTLDRRALGRIIFAEEDRRKTLESILHPRIRELRAARVRELEAEGAELVVSEIPLLFEAGLEGAVDRIVLVDAPVPERLRRLMEDRGMSEEDARRVLASQMDPEAKRAAAHDILDNDGSLEALEAEALALLDRIRRQEVGIMTLDLHLHTEGSWDSLSDPEALLERALARGIDRIAITDHNHLGTACVMAERHPDHVIAGEEVKLAEGIDLIGHYLVEEIPKGTTAARCIEAIREQEGIVYLPHPFAPGKGGGGRLAESLAPEVDVIEGFNARVRSAKRNARAQELAGRFGRPMGAGSDAHTLGEVGNGRVVVARHPNRAGALLSVLPFGRIEGERAPLHVFLGSNWAKLRKRLGA
jgi:dephospho-CoA kinase